MAPLWPPRRTRRRGLKVGLGEDTTWRFPLTAWQPLFRALIFITSGDHPSLHQSLASVLTQLSSLSPQVRDLSLPATMTAIASSSSSSPHPAAAHRDATNASAVTDAANAVSLDEYDEEQVRLMEERCILVTPEDEAYGEGSKKECE